MIHHAMNNNRLALLVMGGCVALAPLSSQAQTATTPPPPPTLTAAPKIRFATNTFDFGKVPVGTVVHATFVLTNVSTAPLEIKDVRPGCGCTTAGTWDRWIEPGKTTTLALQLNTAAFGGALVKHATVTCNDPAQPTVMLLIKGEVWKPIEVQPNIVVFNPASRTASNDVRVVRVINNMEEPITLEPPASSNPAFQSVLKTLKPGKEFELQISVIPPATAGTVQGIITVKTSSTNLPLINVTTMAIVPAAVVTTPSQVMLPSRPLTGPIKITLAIRNDGGEPIALSNPSVSVSNVAVKLSEVQAGQRYNLVLDFPAGFELKPGERGSLVVNTSDPQNPRITVPILQPPAAPKPKASPSVQR